MRRHETAAAGRRSSGRRLRLALGILWLFDGALQFEPSHFSAAFFGSMLRMGTAEPPGWLWDVGGQIEPLLTAHAMPANAAFAILEVAIGLGLVWRRSERLALAVSVPWALGVWLFGESAGGVFSPGASALVGVPGAALLYALVAAVIWPQRAQDEPATARAEWARTLADLAWAALWLGTAAMESDSLNLQPMTAGGEIYSGANGEPGWLAALNHGVGDLVGMHGVQFAICAGVVQAAIGLGVLLARTRRLALVAGLAVGLFYGVVGQDLGGVFSNGFLGVLTSGATDPGTGPIIALFAIALWPHPAGAPDVVHVPKAAEARQFDRLGALGG